MEKSPGEARSWGCGVVYSKGEGRRGEEKNEERD